MRVLDEEKKEAEGNTGVTLAGAGFSAFLWGIAATWSMSAAGAIPFTFVFGVSTLFCLLWFWRCRRTIRAWRQQERERIAVAEAERIGKEGVK
jgi:hypothetical protein